MIKRLTRKEFSYKSTRKKQETSGDQITNALVATVFSEIMKGTVYTVLLRLEKKELVTSGLDPVWNFYQLNGKGDKYLEEFGGNAVSYSLR